MKVASPNPPYCSCCFQQKPHKVHIDFEAYWDGPIIEGKSFKQPIDDLIICEDCLRTAGEVIGLSEHKEMLKVRNALMEEVRELRKYRIDTEEKLASMRVAIS